jgi:hypothetical protein
MVDINVTDEQLKEVADGLKSLSSKWAIKLAGKMECNVTKVYGILYGNVKRNESRVDFIYYGRKLINEIRNEQAKKLTA